MPEHVTAAIGSLQFSTSSIFKKKAPDAMAYGSQLDHHVEQLTCPGRLPPVAEYVNV
jgi:hypothetical protein